MCERMDDSCSAVQGASGAFFTPLKTSDEVADHIKNLSFHVMNEINEFLAVTYLTRGGRMGSGMGLLLEGLWGYHMSHALKDHGVEIAWLPDNQYNDYACVDAGKQWDPSTRGGELFRIEAKTMNLDADESKGHFAELSQNIDPNDLLLIMTWRWRDTGDGLRCFPEIAEVFLERALPLAHFRDKMHLARGGSFVMADTCPDGCNPLACTHAGEPLNERGKRERLSGPESRRPSMKVSFSANFGGLFRMIGARSTIARAELQREREVNPVADRYVRFVNRSRRRMDHA